MGLLDALWHLLNFILPAAAVALGLTALGRIFKSNNPIVHAFIKQFAILFLVSIGVLIAGLLITGRDGKMLTYTAMVLIAGTAQWILSGGWRR